MKLFFVVVVLLCFAWLSEKRRIEGIYIRYCKHCFLIGLIAKSFSSVLRLVGTLGLMRPLPLYIRKFYANCDDFVDYISITVCALCSFIKLCRLPLSSNHEGVLPFLLCCSDTLSLNSKSSHYFSLRENPTATTA